ncbi:TPA: ATP-binding protein [Pseudomonas aeruginosa]
MYQTLVGIHILCSWLDNPGLYEWVQFEADDQQDARGLDDIVLQHPDGTLGLIQVKFTVDAFEPNNALSWAWLTDRKGKKGKSLLEKWTQAAFSVGLERLSVLQLITNRRPDREFEQHLHEGKVDLTAIPPDLRERVEAHAGSAQNAERFFERFLFSHSYADYESLDRTISDALESRHTDHLGWLALYRRAIDWSIHKNSPGPDGRITLDVVRSTISERQPRPLDQEFRVPIGYLPPDPEFADAFVSEAEAGQWDLRVVWGAPGQGKSTFLSYVCKRLHEREVPFIRHHYFLELYDASDRFSLRSVAHSLISQMRAIGGLGLAHLDDEPENLRDWIAASSAAYARQNKRFVVIVDGLDHVWRENSEQIAPLEALFTHLLPLPPNATLLLGTQRVDEAQFPSRLNSYLEAEHWRELPRMCLRSIQAWLEGQHEAGTFQLESDRPLREALTQLSLAFESVSEGHPLVLTYTFLALTRSNPVLSPLLVKSSTPTPLGDARAYYKALWQRLSWDAKDALHLMAEESFIWPAGALELCLASVNTNLELEIGHLLAMSDAGLVAFHGSLYVFIVNQPEHARRVQTLLPNVERWLNTEAPEYLRWAWLWLYQSRRGEHDPLLEGTTRAWAVEALVRAYPVHQISHILGIAEEVAFLSGNYEQAIRKRSLKTRIDHGLDYQIDDADALEDYALRLTTDPYPTLLLASGLNQSSISSLHQLAMLYLSLDQIDRALEVQERMRQKINDRLQARAIQANAYEQILEMYLQVAAGTRRYDPGQILLLLRKHSRSEELFATFLNRASRGGDLSPLMDFCLLPMQVGLRRVLEVEAVRTAAWAQAKLHDWSEFNRFRKHPLSICWSLLYQKSRGRCQVPHAPLHNALSAEFGQYVEAEFARYIHFLFFAAMGCSIQQSGARDPSAFDVQSNRKWLASALSGLADAAHACGALFARGEAPSFSLVYRLVKIERPKNNDHEGWADLRTIRLALVLISADLFLLARPKTEMVYVPSSEWDRCRESNLFALEHWREIFLLRDFHLLSAAQVRAEIEEQERAILRRVEPFNEKGNELKDLCSLATAYGMSDLAERLLAATYRCAIGYGWRKDWYLPQVLKSVEQVSQHDPEATIAALHKLAPIYVSISDMTERSGASPSDLAPLLLKLMPGTFARYYMDLLDRGEWYESERLFASFVQTADFQIPETDVALSFLWDAQTHQVLAERRTDHQIDVDRLLGPWTYGAQVAAPTKDASTRSQDEKNSDSQLPKIENYPPRQFPDFLKAVVSAKQYQLQRKWCTLWFNHWQSQGQERALLTAIASALEQDNFRRAAAETLDLAYALSLRLEGPSKAFWWLTQAHRHLNGWSEDISAEALQRFAIVAKTYPKRWMDFVTLSTTPVSDRVERGRKIPEATLISLLLQVGEIERAVSIMETVVDVTLEEFEMQPLARPEWLEGATT